MTTTLTRPVIDQATIDCYVAKGSRERAQAFRSIFAGLFRFAAAKPSTQTVRQHAAA